MQDQPLHDLYPEIRQQGSLAGLLRGEFRRLNSPLTAVGFDELMGGSIYWAYLKANNRSSEISVAIYERLFLAPFWINGVHLAALQTASTELLARALHAWLIEQYTTKELKAAFPEVAVSKDAAYYEAGPESYVEYGWTTLLDRIRETLPHLYPVVQLAYDTPVLRQLLPYTSLDRLCFSQCTGYPFTTDCPLIYPIGEGAFRVLTLSQRWLGEGDAETALKIALANWPGDYGPAVHGTAENLNRDE
jgi:hypothetical protein